MTETLAPSTIPTMTTTYLVQPGLLMRYNAESGLSQASEDGVHWWSTQAAYREAVWGGMSGFAGSVTDAQGIAEDFSDEFPDFDPAEPGLTVAKPDPLAGAEIPFP